MSNRVKLRPSKALRDTMWTVPAMEAATTPVAHAAATRAAVVEAGTVTLQPGQTIPRRWRARLIEGDRWGSSGYYAKEVVARDGPKVFPIGTQMYLDHPTPTEQAERPVRSVRDLAAYVATTPVYEGDGLYAEIEAFPHAAELVASLASTVGLSIRAVGTASIGEAQGRTGLIFESLDYGQSVDFVTRAGAGGALTAALESARAQITEGGSIGVWLESRLHLALTQYADDMYGQGRLTRPERIALSSAIGDALQAWTARVEQDAPGLFQRGQWDPIPGEPADAVADEAAASDTQCAISRALTDAYGSKTAYVWLRGYDPDLKVCWFDVNSATGQGDNTWQQSYSTTGGDTPVITLTGTRSAVVERTTFVPAPSSEAATVPVPAPPAPAPVPAVEAAAPTPPEEVTPMGTDNTGASAAGTASESVTTVSATEAALTAQLAQERSAREAAEARSTQLVEARAAEANALAQRDAAIQEARTLRANQTGATAVTAALAEAGNVPDGMRGIIAPRVLERITGRVPLTEAGDVDGTALSAQITSAIEAEATYAALLLEAAGHGRVAGLGGTRDGETPIAESEARLSAVFGRLGFSATETATAVKGR